MTKKFAFYYKAFIFLIFVKGKKKQRFTNFGKSFLQKKRKLTDDVHTPFSFWSFLNLKICRPYSMPRHVSSVSNILNNTNTTTMPQRLYFLQERFLSTL